MERGVAQGFGQYFRGPSFGVNRRGPVLPGPQDGRHGEGRALPLVQESPLVGQFSDVAFAFPGPTGEAGLEREAVVSSNPPDCDGQGDVWIVELGLHLRR